MEILTETSNEIDSRVLVSHTELSVEEAVRRISIIASLMYRDAITPEKDIDRGLAQSVVNSDDEIDRLSFFVNRQLKVAVRDSHVLKEINL